MLLELYLILHLKCNSILYQVSSFFEVSARSTLRSTLVKHILATWILDSAAQNHDLGQDSPITINIVARKKTPCTNAKGQCSKGESKNSSIKNLLAGNGSGTVGAEEAGHIVVVRAARTNIDDIQVADVEAPDGVAIDAAPSDEPLAPVLFGD